LNKLIDALAEQLAAAFIKALEPKLQALVNKEISRVKLGVFDAVKPAVDKMESLEEIVNLLRKF
jgi:hypothetical protein